MSDRKGPDQRLSQADELRQEAERRLRAQEAASAERMAEVDACALVHELQVHQIELEMQNEELLCARAAAQQASDKYQDLFDFAPVGYFLLDEQGRILEINLAGARLLGLDRSAAISRRLGQSLAADSRARFAAFLHGVLQSDRTQTCEIALQRGGQSVHAVVEGVRARDAGTDNALHITVTDITQRKAAEQALRQSELRYRTLFESIDEAFCIIQVIFNETGKPIDYCFLETNPAFENQTGLRNAQGKRMRELAPQHEEYWFDAYGKIALTGQPARFERRAEQLGRWYDVFAFRFGQPQERRVAILFRDVNDRKRAEELLRVANDELEHRVEERTAQLAERAEQLRQLAMELTQTEQRERRRLARVLHDDLQQLLVAARMKVGLLYRHNRDGELVPTIRQLDDLLQQTIDGSRSLASRLCPPILYDRGLGAALEWLAQQTREKFDLAVEVEADSAAEPAEETTRVLLFQAAGELLLNAAKHARAQRVWVRVSRTEQQVHLEVGDNGVGFDPARTVQRTDAGGFGMFSIRTRLEVLGGQMDVLTSPGQGTRVVIQAPR